MKSAARRIVSVILCLSLCFIPVLSINASAYDQVSPELNADVPYIHVVGLMTSDIYENPQDYDSLTVWPPQADTIKKAVFNLLPAVFKLIFDHNYDAFSDKLVASLSDVLSPVFLDKDGNNVGTFGARMIYPSKNEIKKDSKLTFYYDWRVDPFIEADNLGKFIDYVLECTGCEKVVLECHSYGGVITYTYAALHGTDKIKSVLYNASAVYGETFTGDLTQGKLVIDPEALTEFLSGTVRGEKNEKFVSFLLSFLYKTGITKQLCKTVNKVIDGTHDRLYREIIYPMFGNWPSIWAMITDEMYDESVDYVFNQFYKDDGIDHSVFLSKIEKFNTEIRQNRTAILNKLNEDCNLYVVARYGYCSMFCTPSWKVANDVIVDVKSASFGATTALYGETFSDEYLADKDKKYISPEKNVDASTCLFPEQTWFIKDYMHMKSNRQGPDKLFEVLLYSDSQATVDTYPEYTRYLSYNSSDESVTPAA